MCVCVCVCVCAHVQLLAVEVVIVYGISVGQVALISSGHSDFGHSMGNECAWIYVCVCVFEREGEPLL